MGGMEEQSSDITTIFFKNGRENIDNGKGKEQVVEEKKRR